MKLSTSHVVIIFVFVVTLSVIGTLIALGGNAGITQSIQGSQVIYTKPNVTDITSALQSQGVGVPHFAINTVSVVTDSDGKQHNQVSSFLNLQPATLIGLPDGILLDRGSIQSQVFAVGDNNQQMVVSGLLSVYLDTKLVGQKHITGQGLTKNNNLPLLLDGDATLNFTFADEGTYNWINGSKHSYSIYISNIQATIGSGLNTHVYTYAGQFLAYVLNSQVDNSRNVVESIYGPSQSVYLADDSVVINANQPYRVIGSTVSVGGSPNFPTITKVTANGVQIDPLHIPRNTQITITIDNHDYSVVTPLTQFQYHVDCVPTVIGKDLPDSRTAITLTGSTCTSNFGYSK